MFLLAVLFCLSCCPAPPPCDFSPVGVSALSGGRATLGLHLPAINPIYKPSLDFSSVLKYPACSVISRVYSCYFLVSRDCFFSQLFLMCLFSVFIQLMCMPQSATPLPPPWFSLGFLDSGVFVLPCFFFSFLLLLLC